MAWWRPPSPGRRCRIARRCACLAAAHRYKASGRIAAGWLWALYLLLVFVAPITGPALAGWGFVDNWLRSRVRAQNA